MTAHTDPFSAAAKDVISGPSLWTSIQKVVEPLDNTSRFSSSDFIKSFMEATNFRQKLCLCSAADDRLRLTVLDKLTNMPKRSISLNLSSGQIISSWV